MPDILSPLPPNVAEEFLPPPLEAPARVLPPPDVGGDRLPPPVFASELAPMPPPIDLLSVTPPVSADPSGVKLAAEEDIELEEDAAPQLTAVQLAERQALATAGELDQQSEQIGKLDTRRRELVAQYAMAKDPDERAELEKRLGAITEADRGVRQAQQESRAGVEESVAQLQAQVGLERQQLAGEAAEEVRTRRAEVQDDARASRERREAEIGTLTAQLATDRDSLRAELKTGPRANDLGQTLAEIFGESLRSSLSGTVPNYAKIMDRSSRRATESHQRRAKARMAEIGLTGDALRDAQRLRDEVAAQAKAGEVAVLVEVEEKLQRELATVTQPLDRVRIATTLESVRQERSMRESQALAARQEANRRRAKEDADLALVEAKTRKEEGLGAKAEAEAVKAARRASGRGRSKPGGGLPGELTAAIQTGQLSKSDAKLVFRQGIIDPATGLYMRRGDGSFAVATDSKNATRLNEAIALTQTTNGLLNEALAMRGAKGWEPTESWYSSDAGKRMAALSTHLLLLNKGTFELGVMSDSDAAILKQIQGGDLAGMLDPRPVLRDLQRRSVEALNTRLRSLVPGSKALSFARVRSVATPTAKSLTTRLNQGPRLEAEKVVPTASERASALDELRNVEIKQAGGDVIKGVTAYQAKLPGIIKRAEVGLASITDELANARPKGLDEAEKRSEDATRRLVSLEQDEATPGDELVAAEAEYNAAVAAQKRLTSPRYKKLQGAAAAQEEHIFNVRREALTGADDIKKSEQLKTEREERAKSGSSPYSIFGVL